MIKMKTLFVQCYKQGIGAEPPWIRNLVGAGEPTAKNGVALEMWSPARNIVSATCTVAVTVQESLWKPPQITPPPLQAAAAAVVLSVPAPTVAVVVDLFWLWKVGIISPCVNKPHPLIFSLSIKGQISIGSHFKHFVCLSLFDSLIVHSLFPPNH